MIPAPPHAQAYFVIALVIFLLYLLAVMWLKMAERSCYVCRVRRARSLNRRLSAM